MAAQLSGASPAAADAPIPTAITTVDHPASCPGETITYSVTNTVTATNTGSADANGNYLHD